MINSLKRTLGFINQHPLAKKHLVRAYFRAISWQVKSGIINKPIKVRLIDKTFFFAQKRLTGITGNIYTGLHEFEEMSFLLHFLKADDVFFDVGANVGSYTILASGVKKAKTIAFEPIPKTYSLLLRNIALNKLENLVFAKNKGVASNEGQLNFVADEDATNHITRENNNKSIVVDVVPLDNFYPAYKPILMKIDVEGFETEVLQGASKILAEQTLNAIIVELNGSGERYGFNEQDIHHKLLAANFEPYSYNPFTRKLTKLISYRDFNTIYIRDINFVINRLETAPVFKVFNEKI